LRYCDISRTTRRDKREAADQDNSPESSDCGAGKELLSGRENTHLSFHLTGCARRVCRLRLIPSRRDL
jgi:hypothetical protein